MTFAEKIVPVMVVLFMLGSSVMVHSNSNIKEPLKQGKWGVFEVFADTMVVCTLTALVILTAGGVEGGVFNVVTGASG